MAAGGSRTKTPAKICPKSAGKRKSKKSQHDHQRLTPQLLSLLSTATGAAHHFLSSNDLVLLPSQTLVLESLLASPSLLFLLPLPSPPPLHSSPWFHRFLSAAAADYDPRWTHFFRMSKPSFSFLLSLVSPSLLSSLPPYISPEAALASALYRLAHAASYKSIARRFGFDSSSDACRAFYNVCKAVNDKLGNLLEFREDKGRIVVGFGWILLPNCCGVLGFGRFGVDCEMLGRDGSILVQALVDSEGRFLDISAGWPCTMKPEAILQQTQLFLGMEESMELLNGPSYQLSHGKSIPQYILGDACFPVLPWLLTPYLRSNEEDSFRSSEKEFNVAHNRAMGLVNTAFGRVRARWKLLAKRWREECVDFFPFAIVMGCLLHNFLIKCNEPLPDDNVQWFREWELPAFEGEVDETGQRIRDALAEHLSRVSLRR